MELLEFIIKLFSAIIIVFIAYKLHKYFHKRDKDFSKKIDTDELTFYKNNGTHFRKPIDECYIIKENSREDVHDVEAKDFRDYISRPSSRYRNEVFVETNKTRISCYVDMFGKERLIHKIVDYDHTVVEIKARMQGYLDVYIFQETEYDGEKINRWFIDTSFLEQELFE